MTMQQMVEAFENQGFETEKIYNKNGKYYRFIIEKDSVEVAGNFKYPAGAVFGILNQIQRDFISNLIHEWYRESTANGKLWCYDCKHYYTDNFCSYESCRCRIHGSLDVDQKERHPDKTADACPDYTPNGKRPWYEKYEDKKGESNVTRQYFVKYAEKLDEIKKGESKMKDNDNLTYVLAQTSAGHLHLMGKPYPVMVKDVTVDGRCAGEAATLLTVEVVGRYGDPNDKLYPKYPNNSPKTVGAVFDTLNMEQRTAVYELIGRALQGKAVYRSSSDLPKIKDVIFNPPATIVFWADNTKTVVKCQEGDDFDAEKGLTMAISKKLFGNKGNYCEEIKKWTKKYQPEPVEIYMDGVSITKLGNMIREAFGLCPEKKEEPIVAETPETADPEGGCPFCKVEGNEKLVDFLNREWEKKEEPEKRWKIWWKKYDADCKVIGSGVHETDYDTESKALDSAVAMFIKSSPDHRFEWAVSQDNPWEKD